MAQRKVTSLQWQMAFTATVTFSDVGNDVVLDLPPGFILLDALLVVTTAFNGTTPTAALKDNKGTPNEVIAAGALTAGVKDIADGMKGLVYPAGGKLTLNPRIAGGTATAGSAELVVTGIVPGRQNERFGTTNAT